MAGAAVDRVKALALLDQCRAPGGRCWAGNTACWPPRPPRPAPPGVGAGAAAPRRRGRRRRILCGLNPGDRDRRERRRGENFVHVHPGPREDDDRIRRPATDSVSAVYVIRESAARRAWRPALDGRVATRDTLDTAFERLTTSGVHRAFEYFAERAGESTLSRPARGELPRWRGAAVGHKLVPENSLPRSCRRLRASDRVAPCSDLFSVPRSSS